MHVCFYVTDTYKHRHTQTDIKINAWIKPIYPYLNKVSLWKYKSLNMGVHKVPIYHQKNYKVLFYLLQYILKAQKLANIVSGQELEMFSLTQIHFHLVQWCFIYIIHMYV